MQLANHNYRQIVQSEDGSHTIYLPELNEHFHSVHGALQESLHVFIDQGFVGLAGKFPEMAILEVGLGTGLNCLLTWLFAVELNMRLHYTALEPFPLIPAEAAALNHPALVAGRVARTGSSGGFVKEVFERIHAGPWEMPYCLHPGFDLEKRRARVEEFEVPVSAYQLIYYDAFGPQAQPGVWEQAVFETMYAGLKPGGLLVTYSARGSVKRALKACGFSLEHPPGPKGKREMTRALKP